MDGGVIRLLFGSQMSDEEEGQGWMRTMDYMTEERGVPQYAGTMIYRTRYAATSK